MLLNDSRIMAIGSLRRATASIIAIPGSTYGHIQDSGVLMIMRFTAKAAPTPSVHMASSFQINSSALIDGDLYLVASLPSTIHMITHPAEMQSSKMASTEASTSLPPLIIVLMQLITSTTSIIRRIVYLIRTNSDSICENP